MEVILFFIILIFFVFSLAYTKKKNDCFNPLLMFYCPFFLQIIFYFVFYKEIALVSNITYWVYICGFVFFGIGYLFCNQLIGGKKNSKGMIDYKNKLIIKKEVYIFLILFVLIGLVLGVLQFINFGNNGPASTFFSNVRWNVNYGSGYNFITKYCIIPITIICGLDLLSDNVKRKKKFFHISILLILCLLNTARTGILSSVLFLLYLWSLKTNKNSINYKRFKKKEKRKIIIIALVLLVTFVQIASSTNKLKSNEGYFLISYIGYPICAFDEYIVPQPGYTNGVSSTGIIGEFLEKTGIIPTKEVVYAHAYGTFNVYSFFSAPYLDFGVPGVGLISFTIGFLLCLLYNLNLKKGAKYSVFYASILYSITMSFYEYTFDLTTYIYVFMFLIIFVRNRNALDSKEVKL